MLPKCPKCNARVIQKSLDGKLKIRTNILVFEQGGQAEVVCKRCGTDIPIDVQLGNSLKKALEEDSPRLVLRKNA